MYITINDSTLQPLQKAGENDKTIKVRIIANHLTLDSENEQILKDAFDNSTVDYFLKCGIIDWHHQSVLGKTYEDKVKAILGKPYDFKWEDNKPVVYADLTKENPYVKAMLPHLEASQPVFAASVGGDKLKCRKAYDPQSHLIKNQIQKILWNHLALSGSPYVINTEAGMNVELVKASTGDIEHVSFDCISNFYNTDLETLTFNKADGEEDRNIEALRKSSIEDAGNALILAIATGLLKPEPLQVQGYLQGRGLSENEAREVMLDINSNINQY